MIYLIANTKGGVGKTTIAVNLAAWFASRARRTLLIDTDKQATAASWASWRRENALDYHPTTVMLRGAAVLQEGKPMSAGFDETVIDAGGHDNPGMRYAMLFADRLIVPMAHSNFDSAAWDDMRQIVETALINNPRMYVCVLLNRIHTSRKAPVDLEKFVEESGFNLCKIHLPERVAFVHASDEGLAVFERRNDPDLSEKVHQLFEEITHG